MLAASYMSFPHCVGFRNGTRFVQDTCFGPAGFYSGSGGTFRHMLNRLIPETCLVCVGCS